VRKASFAAVTLLALIVTVAFTSSADARCRNCWTGGVINGYTPAYYYILYGPPNPDRWVRSPDNWTGPNYSLRRTSVRYYR